MLVSVSIRHGHLSDASQAKVIKKAEKLTRIFERLTAIEVVVDLKDETRPRVDIQVSAEHKHDFVASEQGHDLMVAFDTALHKAEQQLRKYKEKIQERHRDPEARRHEPQLGEEDSQND